MKKIRAIIFDLGGVVAHGGYLGFIKRYCAECFTTDGKKKIFKLEREVNLGKITEKEFYQQIEATFQVHLDPKQMHNLIVKHMKTDQGLAHMIPNLKASKIALFSNSLGHMAKEVLKKRHLTGKKFFDRIFISTEMHLAKPDKKAYQFVLKKLQVQPEEAMMVDDRVENLRPAKAMGMNVIQYKNSRQFANELKKYELI
ncbi:MAG: HAD family phosphatase [Candidatus Doudnabacteria bacterium]|nr:HAD family phosphatase [Candidatus Doudnabacteria bacterium]